ncbi:MAG: NAD-dependent epimerase/dehydratase family protein [Candidatus Omnitrophica bacterium]|nr:NAD-dependent epimerase/dehydratase family protein [Candidatus Omnitrophota bacterium]
MTLVTGGTGFVGAHVVRELLKRGSRVRVLIRKESPLKNLEGLEVDRCVGDLLDRESIRRAMKGCRFLYHVAADYRLWTPDPAVLYRVNVQGTRNVLQAALEAKIERMVYTSTVGALGIPHDGTPGREDSPVSLSDMVGHYKRSKFLAETEVTSASRAGLPVVIVNPSTPVGSMDVKPTPTGQMIVDFLNHRMPAYVETGLNLVDVEAVAQGHLLAMERGEAGRKYILGERNLTLKEILELLSKITRIPAPTVRLPQPVALGWAVLSTGMSALTKRPPRIPLEAVRICGKKMFFDSSRAVRELGFPQMPVEEALSKAVDWFRRNGYVRNGAAT